MFSLFKKIDGWCVALWAGCLSIAFYAIWISFPWLHQWAPRNSSELASWVQAIGAIILILITVFLFNSEQRKLQLEKEESYKLEIYEAKLFFVRNGFLFNNILFCTDLIEYEPPRQSGEKTRLFHYPNVYAYYHLLPNLENMIHDMKEFMVMQAPLGIPRLCVGFIFDMQKSISQCDSLISSRKKDLDKIIVVGDSHSSAYNALTQDYLNGINDELSYSLKIIRAELKNLDNIYAKVSELISI